MLCAIAELFTLKTAFRKKKQKCDLILNYYRGGCAIPKIGSSVVTRKRADETR